MPMTADTHDDLRALAEKATPGPWEMKDISRRTTRPDIQVFGVHGPSDIIHGGDGVAVADRMNDRLFSQDNANMAFIAAANPSRVIALLDEIERLRTALKPFGESDMIGRFDLGHAGEDTCVAGVSDYTYGDLNAARAALAGGPDHD